MEEADEPVVSDDLDVGVGAVREIAERVGLVQGAVRAVPVEMGTLPGADLAQVRAVHDENPVMDLAVDTARPALHDRLAPHRRLHLIRRIGTAGCG